MMNSKTTKKALFGSVMSLVLCCTMLVGTTFAWFTDSVTSSGNRIQAGTLKIDMEVLDNGTYTSVRDMTEPLFDYDKWEPGYTTVKTLKIQNEGNLALKYQLHVIADKADSILADVIDMYMCFGENTATSAADLSGSNWWKCGSLAELMAKADGFTQGKLLPVGATYNGALLGYDGVAIGEITATIALHMKEEAGNQYQGLDFGNIDINLLATQFTYESDSFGDQYDSSASIADVRVEKKITLEADEANAIEIGQFDSVTLDLNNKTYNNSLVNNGEVTVSGGTINTNLAGLENSGVATLTDVVMTAGSPADYSNISYAGSETTYNNVTVDSKGGGIGAVDGAKVEFNSGSVAVNSASTSGRYIFYVVGNGTEVTINDGEFSFSKTLNQKRAYIYVGSGATVYVNGGTFGPASTRSGYTAGILGDGTVIIKGGTFGFDPSNWVAPGYTATESNGIWTVSAV